MPKPRTQKEPQTPKTETGAVRARRASARVFSVEYQEYLERHAHAGDERPKLSSARFEELDDELLDLLSSEEELTDEQVIRLHELEYLLIESEP